MTTEQRNRDEWMAEIRARAVREDYHCREHFAMFDADEDVTFLLQQLEQAEAERDAARHVVTKLIENLQIVQSEVLALIRIVSGCRQ